MSTWPVIWRTHRGYTRSAYHKGSPLVAVLTGSENHSDEVEQLHSGPIGGLLDKMGQRHVKWRQWVPRRLQMKRRGAKMKVSCFTVIWGGSTGSSVSSRLLNKLMIHFQSSASPNHFHVVLVRFGLVSVVVQKQPIKYIYAKQVQMSTFPLIDASFFSLLVVVLRYKSCKW